MTKIKQTSKIRGVACIGIFAAVFLLHRWAQPADAQDASKKLLVAYAGLISTHSGVWLGEDQGFYKKHGLDVTSVFTGSGSITSQALIAGEARAASTSVGPTAGAILAGADLVIVAGMIHILPYQLWAIPQIRQPADLKGKRVAISTFGSGSHLAAEVALQQLGLDPPRDKFAIIQVGTQPERSRGPGHRAKSNRPYSSPALARRREDKGLNYDE